jgi:signal peptidase I
VVIAAARALAGLVQGAVARQLVVVSVHGDSMAPTLRVGDRVLVLRRWPHRWLRRGEVILLKPADRYFQNSAVKRVGAVAGDHVKPGYDSVTGAAAWSGVVGPDEIFIVGDSPRSVDSRWFGPVPVDEVAGLVLLRLASRSGRLAGDR